MQSDDTRPGSDELPGNKDTSVEVLVYVPVHNGKKYIRECLDSIVSQTYPNQTVIVSDNGSDDGTPELIAEEYPSFILQRHTPYIEIANPGLREAVSSTNCKFLINLCYDDILSPKYWETVLSYFEGKDIGLVGVGATQFGDNNIEGAYWPPRLMYNPLDILISNRFFISSVLSREAWDDIEKSSWGGWDDQCFFGDWDMWIQVILSGWKWATCPQPMFRYRRHPKMWSLNYDASVYGEHMTYMRNKWMPELLKYRVVNTTMATPEHFKEARKNT